MAQVSIAVIALSVLIVMLWRANTRFAHVPRLPMQWSLTGSVNWFAPRTLALAFMPCLAALMLAGTTVASIVATSRPEQEGVVVPVIAAMALGLVGAHALYLWLISRTVGG